MAARYFQKHMFIFLKLLLAVDWLNAVGNWFLKKLKKYIKEASSYHHAFLFCVYVCDDELSFINTTQKTLKTFQKNCFNAQNGWERKLHTKDFQQKGSDMHVQA